MYTRETTFGKVKRSTLFCFQPRTEPGCWVAFTKGFLCYWYNGCRYWFFDRNRPVYIADEVKTTPFYVKTSVMKEILYHALLASMVSLCLGLYGALWYIMILLGSR